MKYFRCTESPGDHIGIADHDARIMIVIVEHGAGPDDTDTTAHVDIDATGARQLASRLRALVAGRGSRGAVASVWIADVADELGFILSIGDTDEEKRSVVLSSVDALRFCDELRKAADRAHDGGARIHELMTRRAIALRAVAQEFGASVSVWAAAAWVADHTCELPSAPKEMSV